MRKALFLLFSVTLIGCQREEAQTGATSTGAPKPGAAEAGPPATVISGEFSTPESVVYDPDLDVYFVTNINGSPFGKDDNGYISRIEAETLQVNSKWVDGAQKEYKLDAPKGIAIVGPELWVTDVDVIRRFDRGSGRQGADIPISGTTFLNDLVSGSEGTYATDSGLKQDAAGGFAPSGTDAIYRVSSGGAMRVASGSDLNRPNGLALANGKVWSVSFGGNELFSIENRKKATPTALPKGSLDGLVVLPDGSFLVSSWDAKAVYRGSPAGTFTVAIPNVDAPADIGYDSKRKRLLVPHFMENRLTAYSVQ